MATEPFFEILHGLRATRFRDLSGTTFSAEIYVSERLINEAISGSMRPGGPVREIRVQPLAGNAFAVRLVPRASLLPSITLRVEIDRQAELPSSPVLVLRLATLGGLLGLAGSALPLGTLMPPGVRLQGDRILVDLRAIAADHGAADFMEHLRQLRVNTDDGRVVLQVEVGVD